MDLTVTIASTELQPHQELQPLQLQLHPGFGDGISKGSEYL